MNLTPSNILNHDAGNSPRWWNRLGRFIGLTDHATQTPALVTVWDARREQYRRVDLNDTSDPLWSTANALSRSRTSVN